MTHEIGVVPYTIYLRSEEYRGYSSEINEYSRYRVLVLVFVNFENDQVRRSDKIFLRRVILFRCNFASILLISH